MTALDVPEVDAYWKNGELEYPDRCLACQSTCLSVAYGGLEDLLGQVSGEWGFLVCAQCRSLNLGPRPSEQSIAKAYPSSYVTHCNLGELAAGENGRGLAWSLVNAYANAKYGSERIPSNNLGMFVVPLLFPIRQQMDYFYRHLPRLKGRLLDVGCGHGAFLERAAGAGWEVEGIEPDPQAARVASSRGIKVAAASIQSFTPKGSYDRITLSHVFEHLHHPSRELRTLHSWLSDGGELWMAMPNPGGLGHRLFGRNWFSLDPPRHLMLARISTIRNLLKEAGFESISFLRRGRGSRSSLLPSMEYKRHREGKGLVALAWMLPYVVDLLSSLFVSSSEEIVVLARRSRDHVGG